MCMTICYTLFANNGYLCYKYTRMNTGQMTDISVSSFFIFSSTYKFIQDNKQNYRFAWQFSDIFKITGDFFFFVFCDKNILYIYFPCENIIMIFH